MTLLDDNLTTPLTDRELFGVVRPRMTVDQYDRLNEQGLIPSGSPYELLDGYIVLKNRSAAADDLMTVGIGHIYACEMLADLNAQLRPHGCYMRVEKPVSLFPFDEPEPDGAIVRGTPLDYAGRGVKPSAADILCLVEVADSTLKLDSSVKLRIYADAGVAMYVILSIPDRTARVLREPVVGEGRYAKDQTLAEADTLSLPTAAGSAVDVVVSNLLPPTR